MNKINVLDKQVSFYQFKDEDYICLTDIARYKNADRTLTPGQWIEKTNAIGIISKKGRYGGTYAHKDIAFEFAHKTE